jgi:hypothetical protein
LRFNATRAIGEYIEKAEIKSGALFQAQAAPVGCEKLSNCLTRTIIALHF